MIGWLKRLLGKAPAAPAAPARPDKPPLPDEDLTAFTAWFDAQQRPAIALDYAGDAPVEATGSRLGGPAWLAAGEAWPADARGVPLEFLAQLDMADCTALEGYSHRGVVQFFIGRDDLFGMDLDALTKGRRLVRMVEPDASGRLLEPPPLSAEDAPPFSDFTPFHDDAARTNGVALIATPFQDRIDTTIAAAHARVTQFYREYDLDALWDRVEDEARARRVGHHTGGYAAYTQSDIAARPDLAEFDHTLLRIASDERIMWGDMGEAVFLIRSGDLARGDFSQVVWHWDCT